MRRLTDPQLWKRIESWPLDAADATRPYSAKLAETQGWRSQDAERVVDEYRRFLYLSQVMEEPPAPGAAIDAAWKMHLTYTRNYWDGLVPKVLQRPLHRDAERVRQLARRKEYHDAITTAYLREFGVHPPRDIWQHPMQPGFSGLLVMFFLSGFAVALLGGLILFLIGRLAGLGGDDAAPGILDKAWTGAFLLGWILAFFSPLWAWLISRALPHLPRRNRSPGTTGWSFGIEISR